MLYVHHITHLKIYNVSGYYFAPASSAEFERTYVIYLSGEGSCWDQQSCADRRKVKSLMSSSHAPPSMQLDGLLGLDEAVNPLRRAHSASLWYCSSDDYMGNVGASSVRNHDFALTARIFAYVPNQWYQLLMGPLHVYRKRGAYTSVAKYW